MERKKILELTNFSAGICGVWQRVKQESQELSKKGYEVEVFSSNFVKGSEEITSSEDRIDTINIKRFPAKKLGGESFMKFDFEKEALEFQPDIIIAHGYRHLHTTKALKIAKEIKKEKKCKIFLVTHAPFIENNSTRSFFGKIVVNFYDKFIGPLTINKFDKVIAITKWEMPYLLNLGCRKDKIIYIPNGVPEEFFELKKQAKEENKILFLGRISPIKNLEIAIKAMQYIDKNLVLEIVGPVEETYLAELKKLIKNLNLDKRINFSPAIYKLKKKIDKIDSCKVFVLSSKREAMPQSLIEAMARVKIVVASDIPATRDLIQEGKNGFLFEQGNEKAMAEKISLALTNKKIRKEARKSVEKFNWKIIIKQLESLFQ